ncbi:hypothetical protein CDD82_7921 [Ophiocordyceps australis]|uniref:R3H-associated N-terminal domain-containing protein n=1 Tax=Ophiocordyceps australis TaxID=1399860 RepID=A0A2C5YI69_9HYPO|nr:hypothetical protein CDD82_7921 [Ophiocordyceps australis]
MAINSAVSPPSELLSHQGPLSPPHSTSAVHGQASTVISIRHDVQPRKDASSVDAADKPPHPRSDMQAPREARLLGKGSTRQRRRWDNDRLIGVPNVQPPLPSDWQVHPTHQVHHIPYAMAESWDQGLAQCIQEKTSALKAARKRQQLKAGSATGIDVGEVPRDLRDMSKRSPVIRHWLRTLEEPLRQYLTAARLGRQGHQEPTNEPDLDSDEEEIIFRGRSRAIQQLKEKQAARLQLARRQLQSQPVGSALVYHSLGEGKSAALRRWLTHSLSNYYGLFSQSVTLAGSHCRAVRVGFKDSAGPQLAPLPRPLWELC